MTIDWGKVDEKGNAINENSKSKSITLNESLLPAKWTRVSIVLETLPTSNVRISHYNSIKDHHVFRWLRAVIPQLIPEFK